MEQLAVEKKITCKEFGKAKVFMINQDWFPEVDTKFLDGLDD